MITWISCLTRDGLTFLSPILYFRLFRDSEVFKAMQVYARLSIQGPKQVKMKKQKRKKQQTPVVPSTDQLVGLW